MHEKIRIDSGAEGLVALLTRAIGLDTVAVARLRSLAPSKSPSGTPAAGPVDVLVTTPFQVVASRRVTATIGRDGAVVGAQALLDAVREHHDDAGPPCDASWPGMAPPTSGWQEVTTLPGMVVRQLADKGKDLARQFSGPLGPPASLLDQDVIEASGNGLSASIPMRVVFTLTALGLIPGEEANAAIPREIRVATAGSWLRVDAAYGTVYRSDSVLNLSV